MPRNAMPRTVTPTLDRDAASEAEGLNSPATSDVSRLQGAHYDRLTELYEENATDPATRRYRRRFIDEPLLRGIDLVGANVLEAMCGSGHSTGFLLEHGAHVTGLDVSQEAIELFKSKWPQC